MSLSLTIFANELTTNVYWNCANANEAAFVNEWRLLIEIAFFVKSSFKSKFSSSKFVQKVSVIISLINSRYIIIASLIVSISNWWIFSFNLIAFRIFEFKFLNLKMIWLLNWRRSSKSFANKFCERRVKLSNLIFFVSSR